MTQNKDLLDAERRLAQMNQTVLKCTVAALHTLKELEEQAADGQISDMDGKASVQTDTSSKQD